MSQSSIRSETSAYSTRRPFCNHGECHLRRSFTPTNPGRRFWRCPLGDKPGDCGYFVWNDEPFEGRAHAAVLDCIKKSQFRVDNERRSAAEKFEEMKDTLEEKIRKIREENKSMKQALKETKRRVHTLYFVLVVTYVILLAWIVVGKFQFVSSRRHCLPSSSSS